ncbi:MAG TPA: hypothetical protein VNM69_11695 [Bacillus sp. (in: firmicutes)]|uniref:hypothetical protein n=1 Tax=Bacillus litorisediminis TaxID=2922713 RepID=UPI001FAFB604|nr:hypothetical protein [Bacillus litorisediminis]HWO76540.1 hypothetical protein [Bacillus sp. (in: firmicutes)]
MILRNVLSIIGLIIAIIFGIDGQDISYFLNEEFPGIKVTTFITCLTFISIGLFVVIPILTLISKVVQKEMVVIYFIVSAVIGIPVSFWSILVWGWGMG